MNPCIRAMIIFAILGITTQSYCQDNGFSIGIETSVGYAIWDQEYSTSYAGTSPTPYQDALYTGSGLINRFDLCPQYRFNRFQCGLLVRYRLLSFNEISYDLSPDAKQQVVSDHFLDLGVKLSYDVIKINSFAIAAELNLGTYGIKSDTDYANKLFGSTGLRFAKTYGRLTPYLNATYNYAYFTFPTIKQSGYTYTEDVRLTSYEIGIGLMCKI